MSKRNDVPPASLEPLIGDPSRQARPTIRGLLYQFWRTTEAWIALGPDELLFVEGAEDFDLVTVDGTTTVQIKDNKASGAFTLSTEESRDSINNYWKTRTDNPGRKISFKHLTTAASGIEASGFDREKGVDVWNRCRLSTLGECRSDVERIRAFLLGKKLSSKVLGFLAKEEPAEIKRQLIDSIEWICGEQESREEVVIGHLFHKGKERGLLVSDARTLADQLCLEVAKRASSKGSKPLTFVDLYEKIDRAVTVTIPRETLRQIERTRDHFERMVSDVVLPTSEASKITNDFAIFACPVAPAVLWIRKALLDRIKECQENGIVFLFGGTGMGKTTSVLQAIEDSSRTLWVSLRDHGCLAIVEKCRAIRQYTAGLESPCVVLDDLNPADDPRLMENEIALLSSDIRKRRGTLFVTSYTKAPPRLATAFGLAEANCIKVPELDISEITEFLCGAGCSAIDAGALARVVWVQTSGHPQLVAARISTLKELGFPEPSTADLLERPREIADSQAEALAMVRTMPEAARWLIYRLSMSVIALRREHILTIAEWTPPIPLAGEVFDSVVGPWFQQVSPSRFRISPLLKDCGSSNLSENLIRELHGVIAKALLLRREITLDEFSGLVVHGLLGRDGPTLSRASAMFIVAKDDVKEALARELSWVTSVGIARDTILPIANQTDRQFFRLFQFELAGVVSPAKLPAIAAAMADDFAHDEEQAMVPRAIYLAKLLMQPELKLPIAEVVSHVAEVKRFTEKAQRDSPVDGHTGVAPSLRGGIVAVACEKLEVVFIVPRIRAPTDIDELVSAIDRLPVADRDSILEGLSNEDGELRILFGAAWMSLNGEDRSCIEAYAETLRRAIRVSRRWGQHAWMRAAARALSAVLDELLHRRYEAELVIAEMAAEAGSTFNLEDQLATIAANHMDDEKALAIWNRILPGWNSDDLSFDMQPVFGLRSAGICASRLGLWTEAARLYELAEARAARFGKIAWGIGLRADRGHALWMAHDYNAAVRVLYGAVAALQELSNTPDNFSDFAVQKLVAHVLALLATADEQLSHKPGMCSDLSPSKRIADLPPQPPIFCWYLLHQLASKSALHEVNASCAEKLRDAPYAFLRMTAAFERGVSAVVAGDLNEIPHFAVLIALEMARAKARDHLPIFTPDPETLATEVTERCLISCASDVLWAGLLRAKELGVDATETLSGWKAKELPPCVASEVDQALVDSSLPADALADALRTNLDSPVRRMWAAVLLCGKEDALVEHVAYAHTFLVSSADCYSFLWKSSGKSVDLLIRKDWLRVREAKFRLRNPRIYVDAIDAACQTDAVGWKSAAQIILTWNPATPVSIPEEILRKLRDIARN